MRDQQLHKHPDHHLTPLCGGNQKALQELIALFRDFLRKASFDPMLVSPGNAPMVYPTT